MSIRETEQIDKLFLELSQFTRATTEKELNLARHLQKMMNWIPVELKQNEEFLMDWDMAHIAVHNTLPRSEYDIKPR